MNIGEIQVRIVADTAEFDAATERAARRLAELRAEAEAIKALLPDLTPEIDEVLSSLERMHRVE